MLSGSTTTPARGADDGAAGPAVDAASAIGAGRLRRARPAPWPRSFGRRPALGCRARPPRRGAAGPGAPVAARTRSARARGAPSRRSSGVRQTKASSDARGRDGRPAVADHAVGDPGLVAGSAGGAGKPFAHRALMAVGLLDVRHQQADAPGRPPVRGIGGEQRGDRLRARPRGHAPRAPPGRPVSIDSGSFGATRASVRARASRSAVESPWRTRR